LPVKANVVAAIAVDNTKVSRLHFADSTFAVNVTGIDFWLASTSAVKVTKHFASVDALIGFILLLVNRILANCSA
jgi:hypothetical protein